MKKKSSDFKENNKKELSKKFAHNIPKDFLKEINEEKTIDVLIEMRHI